jgi:hypothetical protein
VKVRLRDDSIRLRLSQREVAALAGGSAVESRTHFSDGAVLACRVAPGAGEIRAALDGCTIALSLPAQQIASWAAGDELAIGGEQEGLRISVEKDLECRHARPGEDDTDAFPVR